MKKRSIFIIILSIAAILLGLIFIFILKPSLVLVEKNGAGEDTPADNEVQTEREEKIDVNIQTDIGNYVLKEKNIPDILSTDLLLNFIIKLEKGSELESVRLDDTSLNLLSADGEFGLVSISYLNDGIKLSPTYILDPTNHTLNVAINKNNKTQEFEYNFLLKYEDNFSDPKKTEQLWSKPLTAVHPDDFRWSIETGKLLGISTATSIYGDRYASLAFLRRVSGDINIDFDINVTSNKTNLVVYFYESRVNFLIGGVDNTRIFYGVDNERGSVNFKTEKGSAYSFRVERINNKYQIIDLKNGDILASFQDDGSARLDAVGFAIWNNSNGIEITKTKIWWQDPEN